MRIDVKSWEYSKRLIDYYYLILLIVKGNEYCLILVKLVYGWE